MWTYDKDAGVSRSAIPEETAIFTHFYSVERDDGSYDTSVEEFLAYNESKAAPIYKNIITHQHPNTHDDRSTFSLFLALLYLRTLAKRNDAAKVISRAAQIHRYAYGSHENAFRGLIHKLEEERGEKISSEIQEEVRRRLIDPTWSEILVHKAATLTQLQSCDKIAHLFFNMHWIMVTPRNGFFITSDNPIVKHVSPDTISPIYGDNGFLNKSIQVTFALSPQLMLMMAWDRHIPKILEFERPSVEAWNQLRALHAEKYLYSHLQHRNIQRLADRTRKSRPTLTTQGFGPKEFAAFRVPRKWHV